MPAFGNLISGQYPPKHNLLILSPCRGPRKRLAYVSSGPPYRTSILELSNLSYLYNQSYTPGKLLYILLIHSPNLLFIDIYWSTIIPCSLNFYSLCFHYGEALKYPEGKWQCPVHSLPLTQKP
jgi:hypothetical protein